MPGRALMSRRLYVFTSPRMNIAIAAISCTYEVRDLCVMMGGRLLKRHKQLFT